MPTSVCTLEEFAEDLQQLAEDWEGEQPAVIIGNVQGNVSVTEKDGFTEYGCVGIANEIFDGNGVYELGQLADHRFYGTMLMDVEDLNEEAREQLRSDGGDA